MKKQTEVRIFGQTYTISGESDEKYVSELARYVDSKMKGLSKSAKNVPPNKLALLAAVNITHELFKLRDEKNQKDQVVESKTKDMIDRIDEQFTDLRLY